MARPDTAPCSMVVSSAAPRPFPLTSAMRIAVRSSADRNHVEVVAADLGAGMVHAGDGKMRKIVQAVRHQRLLDGPRDGKLLLQALPLALPLHQARVVENAGRLHRERVENLAVERRKRRDAPRVEINHAQQLARCFRSRARVGNVARDEAYSGMATTARNPCITMLSAAFRSRPARFRSSVITLDACDRLVDRGLARVEGLRRQVVALVAAGQTHAQRARGVRLDKQPAIGVGDGDGVIQHRAQYGIEGQLRVQQRSRFQKQIQLAQSAGMSPSRQFRKRADAGEQVGHRRAARARRERRPRERSHGSCRRCRSRSHRPRVSACCSPSRRSQTRRSDCPGLQLYIRNGASQSPRSAARCARRRAGCCFRLRLGRSETGNA